MRLCEQPAATGRERGGGGKEGGGDIPGGHGRRDEAGDAQRGGHVDVDDVSEFFRGRVDKVCGDLVGYPNVVNYPERGGKQRQQPFFVPLLREKGGITHRARRLRWT